MNFLCVRSFLNKWMFFPFTLGPVLNFMKGLGVSGYLILSAMKIVFIHE